MKRLKLLGVLLLLLACFALPPTTSAAIREPICEIYCWDYGTVVCHQDSYCNYSCCNVGDPGCWNPCW